MCKNDENVEDRETTEDLEKVAAGCYPAEFRRGRDVRTAPDLGGVAAGAGFSHIDRAWRRDGRLRGGAVPDPNNVAIG